MAANGGVEVGGFEAPIDIGSDIFIQTPPAGVNVFSGCTPFTINWTGSDQSSWVTVSLIQSAGTNYGGYEWVNWAYQTRTANGTMTILPPVPPADACGTGPLPIEIAIEVDPDPSEITTFSASGLSLGGQVTWKYIHTFLAGLSLD